MSDGSAPDGLGHVAASDHRETTVRRLTDSPATPSVIAEDIGLDTSHVSRALKSLRGKDLVELLVDEDRRKGRVYALTAEGEEVVEFLDEMGGGEK